MARAPACKAPGSLLEKAKGGTAARPFESRFDELARRHTIRSTIIFLIDAIAFAGFSPFGQVLAQFMIVWQR